MKRWKNVGWAAAILAACILVIVGSLYGATTLLKSAPGNESCQTQRTPHTYQVTIKNDAMNPSSVTAKLCDRLTITNADAAERLIAFGPHEHHVPYDGITERLLGQGQSVTITLNMAGTYTYHDHFHDDVSGSFTVTK